MSTTRAETPLSGIEFVVLACLSQSKKKLPSDEELGTVVTELCLPDEPPGRGRSAAMDALASLRRRGLVDARGKTLSKDGARTLCDVLGLAKKPSWTQVRDRHLPALGLGLHPGAEAAATAVRDGAATIPAVLRWKLSVHEGATPTAVCDALIAELLGMSPGRMTLDRIRAHVLARRAKVNVAGKSAEIAARVAADAVGSTEVDKRSLAMALGRRWLRARIMMSSLRAGQSTTREPSQLRAMPRPDDRSREPPQQPPDDLLDVVREAISQIGAEGRFGAEKVFVSALWHRIECSGLPAQLSFDRFKRWLISANRDGTLTLARADLIGAMDAKQVAESEIRDRNATFHFVVDLLSDRSNQGASHAR